MFEVNSIFTQNISSNYFTLKRTSLIILIRWFYFANTVFDLLCTPLHFTCSFHMHYLPSKQIAKT